MYKRKKSKYKIYFYKAINNVDKIKSFMNCEINNLSYSEIWSLYKLNVIKIWIVKKKDLSFFTCDC